MNLRIFSDRYQNELEQFLVVMYSSRGYKFEPDGLQSDIRNIESVYVSNGGNFWILMIDDKIVGTIALKVIDSENRIGEIKRYFVLPSYQDQGLGTMLIESVIEEAIRIDLKILRLDTMRKSTKAISIFKKHHFYEIEKYNDNHIAEIFMEITLDITNQND